MKVLNLYAGIGGNRKLWTGCEVTAVEYNEAIANIYKQYYPEDNLIISDAHEYLLQHYNKFDFVWVSTPCPSHSRARYWGSKGGLTYPVYPDWHLWQEIIFLKHFCKGKWVVENVVPYYEPFIKPTLKIDKHYIWSNFPIKSILLDYPNKREDKIDVLKEKYGFYLSGIGGINKTQIMRNLVNPELGLYIMEQAMNIIREPKGTQQTLF